MTLSQMFVAVLAVATCAAGGTEARLGAAGLSVEKKFLPEHSGRLLAQFGSLGGDVGKSMGSCSDPYVQAMVAADNADRGGIGAFKCDEAMSQMAIEHSKAMCNSRKLSHDGFSQGKTCPDSGFRCSKIRDLGYNGWGENVLWHQKSLNDAVAHGHSQWMKSPGHRANIMRNSFTAVGYGFYVCANNDYRRDSPAIYMTGLFGGGQ